MNLLFLLLASQSLLELAHGTGLTQSFSKYHEKAIKGKRLQFMDHKYSIPRLRALYSWKTFEATYKKIYNREFYRKSRKDPEFQSDALYFLKYSTSYTPLFNKIMPETISKRILFMFMGKEATYSGQETQKALIKLGGEAINSFAEFINDINTTEYFFYTKYHFTYDQCHWVPILQILPETSLSIVSLVKIAAHRRTESACGKEFIRLIDRNLKSILPRRREYRISNMAKDFHGIAKIDPKKTLYWKQDGNKYIFRREIYLIDPTDTEQAVPCYQITDIWQNDLHKFYEICNSRVKQSSYFPWPRRIKYETVKLEPKEGNKYRSTPALQYIMRSNKELMQSMYLSVAFKETKEITLSHLEYAFNQFIATVVLEEGYDKYCTAIKKFVEEKKDIKPFWDGLHMHYVTVEEVSKILCGTVENYTKKQMAYQQKYYRDLYFKGNYKGDNELPKIDTTTIEKLKAINALGVYITDCVMYNFKSRIEELFALGITIDEFLAIDDLHFFLLDAKLNMLLFFFDKIDFSVLSSDRAYHLWERILASASKFPVKDENTFFKTLLTKHSKSLEGKTELSIVSEEKPAPSIDGEEKPAPSLDSEEKPAPSIALEEKLDPSNTLEQEPDASVVPEEKQFVSFSEVVGLIRASNKELKDFQIKKIVRKHLFISV